MLNSSKTAHVYKTQAHSSIKPNCRRKTTNISIKENFEIEPVGLYRTLESNYSIT